MMRKRTRGYLKSISLKKQKLKYVTIEDLPNEMLEKIFAYLNIRSRGNCAQMSQRFRSVILDLSQKDVPDQDWDPYQDWDTVIANDSQVPASKVYFALSVGCKTLHLRHSLLVSYFVDYGNMDY